MKLYRNGGTRMAYTGLCLFGLLGAMGFLEGCPKPAPSVVERSYEAAIISCASAVGLPGKYDRAADMRCRAAVDCAYHIGPCGSAVPKGEVSK